MISHFLWRRGSSSSHARATVCPGIARLRGTKTTVLASAVVVFDRGTTSAAIASAGFSFTTSSLLANARHHRERERRGGEERTYTNNRGNSNNRENHQSRFENRTLRSNFDDNNNNNNRTHAQQQHENSWGVGATTAASVSVPPISKTARRIQYITSPTNPLVKHFVKLRSSRAYRNKCGSVLVTGNTLVRELLLSPFHGGADASSSSSSMTRLLQPKAVLMENVRNVLLIDDGKSNVIYDPEMPSTPRDEFLDEILRLSESSKKRLGNQQPDDATTTTTNNMAVAFGSPFVLRKASGLEHVDTTAAGASRKGRSNEEDGIADDDEDEDNVAGGEQQQQQQQQQQTTVVGIVIAEFPKPKVFTSMDEFSAALAANAQKKNNNNNNNKKKKKMKQQQQQSAGGSGVPFVVVLDQVSDPGNMGTILRSAIGLGYDGVCIMKNSVDPFNDKCIRSARCAHFHTDATPLVYEQSWQQVAKFALENDMVILVASSPSPSQQQQQQQQQQHDSLAITVTPAAGTNTTAAAAISTSTTSTLSDFMRRHVAGGGGGGGGGEPSRRCGGVIIVLGNETRGSNLADITKHFSSSSSSSSSSSLENTATTATTTTTTTAADDTPPRVYKVSIPMQNHVESLNVGAAAAIILYAAKQSASASGMERNE